MMPTTSGSPSSVIAREHSLHTVANYLVEKRLVAGEAWAGGQIHPARGCTFEILKHAILFSSRWEKIISADGWNVTEKRFPVYFEFRTELRRICRVLD
jgi:hypothetical protein